MWKAPVSAGNNLVTMPSSLLYLYSGFGIFIGILLLTPLASILTIVTSWLLLKLYKKSVGKLMRTFGNATKALSNIGSLSKPVLPSVTRNPGSVYVDSVSDSHEGMFADRLYRQLIAALVMCVPYVFAFSQTQINPLGAANHPLQFLLMWWTFIWPGVLTTIFIVNPAWQRKCTILFGYFVVLMAFSAFVTLIPTEAASQWGKGTPAWSGETPIRVAGRWIGFNLMPTLLLIAFRNRRIRAIAPLMLAFMTVLSAGVLSVLTWAFIDKENFVAVPVFISASLGLSIYDSVIASLLLLSLLACCIFGMFGWWFLLRIRKGYLLKSISDQSLTLDAVWLLFGSFYSMFLALAGPGWAASGIAAFLAYKATLQLGNKRLLLKKSDDQSSPALLVLRVFSLGKRSEVLFENVAQRWRYLGNVQLIAGTDLAASTVAPHQFLSFVSGKLKLLFINNEEAINRSIRETDVQPDADGRFRINDFLCRRDTWQSVLSGLIKGVDEDLVVLMDLRNFTKENDGCIFELNELLNVVPVQRLVLVVDNSSDKDRLNKTLEESCGKLRSDSPNLGISPNAISLFELKSMKSGELQKLLSKLCTAAGNKISNAHLPAQLNTIK
jgi:hypothetical protein